MVIVAAEEGRIRGGKEGMPSFMYPQSSDQETPRVAEIEEVTQKGES